MTRLQQSMQQSFSQRIVDSESSCRRSVVFRIAVGLETKYPKSQHMTADHRFNELRHVSLAARSLDPSNATGTTSSVVMRANLRQNDCSMHMRVCLVRAPVACHTWQYLLQLAFWLMRIPVELTGSRAEVACSLADHVTSW